jgi:enoyl-CoA hydratase
MNTVNVTITDSVAVIRIDDGKANALSHEVIEQLHTAIDTADRDATAICFIGREGKLCAGFDLSVMTAGPDSTRNLVRAGGELLMRIYGHPQPTVVACTGHALAAGALFLLSCDTRIGAEGNSKIGLNETAIGRGLPAYAVELARDRLSKRHFTASALQARIYDPAGAVEAGYLDQIVPLGELEATAIAAATQLGRYRRQAYALTKQQSRGVMINTVLADLEADMLNMVPPMVNG